MTPETLDAFLKEYRATYQECPKDHQIAKLMGVGANTFTRLKQRGAPLHSTVFLLALSALMHNLGEYGKPDERSD